jgi:SulP family sulfate permease
MAVRPAEPTFAELFTPKLVTILREGYGLLDLRADAIAGLTVAIVGGFLVSLLGEAGSRSAGLPAPSSCWWRHRSNCELVAQGVANIASSLFGGICVTGTIARTATNVRSAARGPVSGLLHAVFLLLFMLVAAPLASYIPLSALAAVLAVVAWNTAEKHEFATLLRASRGDAVVLMATFLLVVFRDLTESIVVGFGIGALLFLHRMAQAVEIESGPPWRIRPMRWAVWSGSPMRSAW